MARSIVYLSNSIIDANIFDSLRERHKINELTELFSNKVALLS